MKYLTFIALLYLCVATLQSMQDTTDHVQNIQTDRTAAIDAAFNQ